MKVFRLMVVNSIRKLVALSLIAVLLSCDEGPYVINCITGNVGYETVYGSSLSAPRFVGLDNVKMNTHYVIQYDGEYYEKYFENQGNSLPKINFKEKTLLAGRIYTPTGDAVVSVGVLSNCVSKTLTVYVTTKHLQRGSTDVIEFDSYAVIIPKISEDTKVIHQVIKAN